MTDPVRLTRAAEADLEDIWLYTCERWGAVKADAYFEEIAASMRAIADGASRSGVIEGLSGEVRVHRCARHSIFVLNEGRPIVIAILHDRMDLLTRIKGRL